MNKKDIPILFTTRIIRLFCYGFLSVILVLYLAEAGLTESQAGLLFTFTLAGDAVISLWLTTRADSFGRKKTLILGALLMLGAGIIFLLTNNLIILIIAAIIGVISPSGNEIGPFLSIEQAGLTQLVSNEKRTNIFAWYNLAGSFSTALGSLAGGWLAQSLQLSGWTSFASYRVLLIGYAIGGLLLAILFFQLSSIIEATRSVTLSDSEGSLLPKVRDSSVAKNAPSERHTTQIKKVLGLHQSKNVVFKLSALFALDAFAGGLIVQSMMAYWFYIKFGVDAGILGSIFFGANILAGISALSAVKLAKKFGLINTMVFTHIPSNILLILVPLMPTLPLAIGLLLLRFSISQMDVPTRQSYTMAVVSPDERSAASGVTAIARSIGASLSPMLTGFFFSIPILFSTPFFMAGGLKIVYDLLLYREFVSVTPPEEK